VKIITEKGYTSIKFIGY